VAENAPEAAAPERPAWLPAKFKEPEALAASYVELEKKLGERRETLLAELRAEMAKDLPESPDAYELALPEGFAVPQGFEFRIEADDPLAKEARQWAHRHKLPKGAFTEAVGLFAKAVAGTLPDMKAERAKLGERADERLAQLDGYLAANLSEKAYRALQGVAQRAEVIEALEEVVRLGGAEGMPGKGSGAAPVSAANAPFTSEEEVRAAMRDKRYYTDSNYRKSVFERAEQFFAKQG
jgi:hypothetical protein